MRRAVPSMGYVYVVVDQSGARAKIGRTADLWRRFAELRYTEKVQLKLAAFVKCASHDETRATERWLHARMGHARIRGEWFILGDAEVQELIEVCRYRPIGEWTAEDWDRAGRS